VSNPKYPNYYLNKKNVQNVQILINYGPKNNRLLPIFIAKTQGYLCICPSNMFVTSECPSVKGYVHPIWINTMLTFNKIKLKLLCLWQLPRTCHNSKLTLKKLTNKSKRGVHGSKRDTHKSKRTRTYPKRHARIGRVYTGGRWEEGGGGRWREGGGEEGRRWRGEGSGEELGMIWEGKLGCIRA
jgi:hypothetical protein